MPKTCPPSGAGTTASAIRESHVSAIAIRFAVFTARRQLRSATLFFQSRTPLGDSILLLLEKSIRRIKDLDLQDLVSLRDRVDHILTLGHLPKDGVLAVQPGSGNMGDKELAAIGDRPSGIGHREDAGFVMLEIRSAFIFKGVARAATTRSRGISPLDHEVGNHAVESDLVVIALLGEVEEIGHGDGRL